ncbi:MAG TPA: hypothetical protein VNZ05_10200 [Solirubrobacteraceae bacterium]|jgi:hypothetical protein|nr:hypothetical protein [Solirubrobacteraceae bacterium]
MRTRTLERLCIVGLVDLFYRLVLRDLVRAQIGMETRARTPSASAGS